MDSPYDEDQRTYQNTVVRGLYAMGAMQRARRALGAGWEGS